LTPRPDIEAGSPAGPDQRGADAGSRRFWLKLAALALVVAGLGLPLNDLFRYAILVIATVLIFTGVITTGLKAWIGAAAVVGLCVLAQIFLAAPRIEEGHNVFVVDGPGGALAAGLPPEVFRFMRAEFDAKYPPERRCDARDFGCWRGEGFPDRPFAFSADGLYDRPAHSRRVTGIDFADPVWLRLGFINELRYNWISPPSDLDRASRDRRFWVFVHRWTLQMPWFVMYRFPAAFAGSARARGDVLWRAPTDISIRSTIAESCAPRRPKTPAGGFSGGDRQDLPLVMHLEPTTTICCGARSGFARALSPARPCSACWCACACAGRSCRSRHRARLAVTPSPRPISSAAAVRFRDDGLVFDGLACTMLQQPWPATRGALRAGGRLLHARHALPARGRA
jgi:hypothetical protein